MAYRNGTYVAFHAQGTSDPSESDIKYYNTLKMWKIRDDSEFKFIDSHEKRGVRDSSGKQALRRALMDRMNNSKHLLLIIGDTTRFDTDWVPFEISYAVDTCKIPIIAAYPGYKSILNPASHSNVWPKALADRISNKEVRVIHVPFKKEPIKDAISQFDFDNHPNSSMAYYSKQTYIDWELLE